MESTALTVFQPKSIHEATELATVLSKSTLLPEALRGKTGDILVTIITGQELGLTAMQAIRGINVIKGKPSLSADLMVALVKRHPDCIYFKLVSSTDKIATYETERRGEGATKMSFTIEQAVQAGLGGEGWKRYPAAMLRARASSALARAVYPDMMLGVYDEDEAKEIAGTVERRHEVDVTPAPSRTEQIKQAIRERAPAVKLGESLDEAETRHSVEMDEEEKQSIIEAERQQSQRDLALEQDPELDHGQAPEDFRLTFPAPVKGKMISQLTDKELVNQAKWRKKILPESKPEYKQDNERQLHLLEEHVAFRGLSI